MVAPNKTRMTAHEFFQLEETMQPTELINGELIVSPSPVPSHQLVLGEFDSLIKHLIPDGRVFIAPMDVYFDDDNVLQPDIIWVAEQSKCVITDKHLEGTPELVVEIFSLGTTKHDKSEKYDLYEKYGVREYWMVSPSEQYVEVYLYA